MADDTIYVFAIDPPPPVDLVAAIGRGICRRWPDATMVAVDGGRFGIRLGATAGEVDEETVTPSG